MMNPFHRKSNRVLGFFFVLIFIFSFYSCTRITGSGEGVYNLDSDGPVITPPAVSSGDGENSGDELAEGDDGSAEDVVVKEEFFPLGVYMPWGSLQHVIGDKAQLKKFFEDRCADLAAHNVNQVWTSAAIRSPEELKMLIEAANPHDIRVIASIPAATYTHVMIDYTESQWQSFLLNAKNTIETWFSELNGVYPYAVSITEEADPKFLNVYRLGILNREVYTALDGRSKVTMTTMPNRYGIMNISSLDMMPFITSDTYMFFGDKCGAYLDHYSYRRFDVYTTEYILESYKKNITPWMFLQAMQAVWGNWKKDENGNVVLLPGAILHRRMPTPENIKWQIWSSIAMGAKGINFFTYGVKGKNYSPSTNWEPDEAISSCYHTTIEAGMVYTEETNTGSPISLVSWPEYTSSPQYEVMSETYTVLNRMKDKLFDLKPVPEVLEYLGEDDWTNPEWKDSDKNMIVRRMYGDEFTLLKDSEGKTYLALVKSPLRDGALMIAKSSHFVNIASLARIDDSFPTPVDAGDYISVDLDHGEGAIYLISTP